MTKEQLKEYKVIEIEIKQIERQLEELEASVYDVRAILNDGMPKKRGKKTAGGDFSELLIKFLDMKVVYEKKWDELIDLKAEIEKAIEGLPSRERSIMRAKYIEGLTWEGIAIETNYSVQRIFQLHSAALKKIVS